MYARSFVIRPPARPGKVRTDLREALALLGEFAPPVRLVLVMLTGPGRLSESGVRFVERVEQRHEVTLLDEEGPIVGASRHLTPAEAAAFAVFLEEGREPGGDVS